MVRFDLLRLAVRPPFSTSKSLVRVAIPPRPCSPSLRAPILQCSHAQQRRASDFFGTTVLRYAVSGGRQCRIFRLLPQAMPL